MALLCYKAQNGHIQIVAEGVKTDVRHNSLFERMLLREKQSKINLFWLSVLFILEKPYTVLGCNFLVP